MTPVPGYWKNWQNQESLLIFGNLWRVKEILKGLKLGVPIFIFLGGEGFYFYSE